MATMRLCLTLMFLFILGFHVPPATGAETDDAGAQKLKTMFEEILERQKAMAKVDGRFTVDYNGEISVEPSETYYAVTLPYLQLTYYDGTRIEVGIISINTSPHTKPGQWTMVIAMPTPIVVLDTLQNQTLRLDIGAQQAAGIFHEDSHNFSKLDATYKDITFEGTNDAFIGRIPELEIRYDFEKNESGLWSGPGFALARNFQIDFEQSGSRGSIGEIKARFDLKNYNPSARQDYQKKLMAMLENEENAKNTNSSRNHILGLYNMIFDFLGNAGDGFNSQYSISNAMFKYASYKNIPANLIKWDQAYMGLDMSGFMTDMLGIAARFGFKGFYVEQTPPEFQDLRPSDANFDIVIEKLPFKQISEFGKNTVEQIVAQPDMQQLAGVSFFLKLPALLSQAGTTIRINDNYISNDHYKIDTSGKIKADITAVNSATADIKTTFFGLDKILAKTQVLAANPHSEHAENFRDLSAKLERLKGIAKVETTTDNKFAHVFELIMNPQGRFLLNGEEISKIMNGQTSQSAPAE